MNDKNITFLTLRSTSAESLIWCTDARHKPASNHFYFTFILPKEKFTMYLPFLDLKLLYNYKLTFLVPLVFLGLQLLILSYNTAMQIIILLRCAYWIDCFSAFQHETSIRELSHPTLLFGSFLVSQWRLTTDYYSA